MNKNHKLKYLLFALISIFCIPLLADRVYAVNNVEYKIYTDGTNNVKWQYAYISDTDGDRVEISFFDKNDDITAVTVPSISDLRNNNSSIPESVTRLDLVNYTKQTVSDGTVPEHDVFTNISEISLINVTNVNGVYPMINISNETKIVFSPTGSTIGDAQTLSFVGYVDKTGVFEGANVRLENIEHVTSIGARAFKDATLANTDLSLNNLEKIGDGAFWGTNLTKIELDVEDIYYNAFRNCTDLTTVEIGNKVKVINDAAFKDDIVLENIDFKNVNVIGNYAFSGCTTFNVDISDTSFTTIGDAAFENTTGYTHDTTIPDGVENLGYRVFYKSGITGLNLNNVKTVGYEAFAECESLSNVEFGATEKILWQAFHKDTSLTKVEFTDSVKYVETRAFQECNIQEVNLNKVEVLLHEAFDKNDINELYLPRTLVRVDSKIFNNNKNLKKVTVAYDTMLSGMKGPNNQGVLFFSLLGEQTCDNVEELILVAPYEDGDNFISSDTYNSTRDTYNPTSISGGSSDVLNGHASEYKNIIRENYFYGLKGLKKITIGEGYEFIGAQAFFTNTYSSFYAYGYTQERLDEENPLTEVNLPSTLKGIGVNAFIGTLKNSNTKINLPEGLEYIGYQSFSFSDGFQNEVDIESLKFIGSDAFFKSGIKGITLRDNLTFFGKDALLLAPNIKNITVDVDLYSLNNVGDNSYNGTLTYDPDAARFYGHVGDFQNNHEFDTIKFTDKVKTEPCKNFEHSACRSFMYNINAKEVSTEETGWTKIGPAMFLNANIEKITVPKNSTAVAELGFYGTTSSEVIDLPDTIKIIGANAFNSANLKINQIPKYVERLEQGAFFNSDFHSDPIIPETVTYIGLGALNAPQNTATRIKRNSITFENNLTPDVTLGQPIMGVTANTDVDNLYFGDKVTELPSNTLGTNYSEFYQMNVKNVVFKNLKVLPDKAFLDCPELLSVDFSEDENLTDIKQLAFYRAQKLNNVKFANKGTTINLGYSAFRDTGLTSIGGSDSDFDLTSANFVTDTFVFSENKKLEKVEIPNGYNKNEISEFTFWDCTELKEASIGNEIKTIKSYAFCGDSKLDKIFLWGDTEIEQDLSTYDEPITDTATIAINNQSKKEDLEFKILIDGEVVETITPDKFISGYANGGNNTYSYLFEGNGELTFDYPKTEVYITVAKSYGVYEINIIDINPANFTIPSQTDIYTYSMYKGYDYDEEYEKMRRNEKLGTDSKVYALDEVLYLTSNHAKVKLNEDETDFDKSDLVVYALRRDGIIMQSDKWGEFTKHYSRKDVNLNFEKYDATNTEKEKIVYDYPFNAKNADVSTENFANMTFEIYTNKDFIQKKEIKLFYTNYFLEDSTVDTNIKPYMSLLDIVETGDNLIKIVIMFVVALLGSISGFIIYKKNKKIV